MRHRSLCTTLICLPLYWISKRSLDAISPFTTYYRKKTTMPWRGGCNAYTVARFPARLRLLHNRGSISIRARSVTIPVVPAKNSCPYCAFPVCTIDNMEVDCHLSTSPTASRTSPFPSSHETHRARLRQSTHRARLEASTDRSE